MADMGNQRRDAARKMVGKTDLGMKKGGKVPTKGSPMKMEKAEVKKPLMLAAGGVAKMRRDVADKSGAPKKAPRAHSYKV